MTVVKIINNKKKLLNVTKKYIKKIIKRNELKERFHFSRLLTLRFIMLKNFST